MERKQDIGKQNYKCSRGYCGFYNGWYLRSLREYKTARYLVMISCRFSHITVDYEPGYKTYTVNGKSYKPDFYLYKAGILRYIIEVKSSRNEAIKYMHLYSDYFDKHGIKYIVVYSDAHFTSIERHANIIKDEISAWKVNSIYDYSGEYNPAFGRVVSDDTRRKIGDRTRERAKKVEYRKKLSDSIKQYYVDHPQRRKHISEQRKRTAAQKKKVRNILDPVVEVNCDNCNKFIIRRLSEVKVRRENGYIVCSPACGASFRRKVGIIKPMSDIIKRERFRRRLQLDIQKIIQHFGELTEEIILKAKREGVIYLKSPLSCKSLLKYFGSVDIKEILNGKNS